MDLTILMISSLCRGQCAVVLKNQKNYHLNVAWCWFLFSVMIKIVHTVSPGSPFSPALPCNWTEISLIIINPPTGSFWKLKTESNTNGPAPPLSPDSPFSPFLPFSPLNPRSPCQSADAFVLLITVCHLYTIKCCSDFMCLYFHLVPLQTLSWKTSGPRNPLKTRLPLKTQALSTGDNLSDRNALSCI